MLYRRYTGRRGRRIIYSYVLYVTAADVAVFLYHLLKSPRSHCEARATISTAIGPVPPPPPPFALAIDPGLKPSSASGWRTARRYAAFMWKETAVGLRAPVTFAAAAVVDIAIMVVVRVGVGLCGKIGDVL